MIYLYELICPMRNRVCYVGLTNNPHKRLLQHKRDCYRYKTKIAKYVRHLKKKGLEDQLEMQLIASFSCQYEAGEYERQRISLRRMQGKIYNILDGGYEQAPNFSMVGINKMIAEGRLFGGCKSGEECPRSVLKEAQILQIYKMIKQFYSNKEILTILGLDMPTTTISAIRSGENWPQLWKKHFTIKILAPGVIGGVGVGWITPRDKVCILLMANAGWSYEVVRKYYPRLTKGDFKRASCKSIWIKVVKFVELHPDLASEVLREKFEHLAL